MTDAEKVLWTHLRARRLGGYKFRRQVPLGPYVVDFFHWGARLAVEADGPHHRESDRDSRRDGWLAQKGVRVLRFWNHDILQNTQGVLDVILGALAEPPYWLSQPEPRSIVMSMSDKTGTVRLHRVLKAPRARVYRAFVDPAAMCKWLPPYGFTGTMHSMDARVGGGYRMSFTNFSTGSTQAFGGRWLEMVEGERLRYTDAFEDPNLPGQMDVVVEFAESVAGTSLTIVQSGIPAAIPADFCYQGWQESLKQLARLVEPEIPDA